MTTQTINKDAQQIDKQTSRSEYQAFIPSPQPIVPNLLFGNAQYPYQNNDFKYQTIVETDGSEANSYNYDYANQIKTLEEKYQFLDSLRQQEQQERARYSNHKNQRANSQAQQKQIQRITEASSPLWGHQRDEHLGSVWAQQQKEQDLWDTQRISMFRSSHKRKLPVITSLDTYKKNHYSSTQDKSQLNDKSQLSIQQNELSQEQRRLKFNQILAQTKDQFFHSSIINSPSIQPGFEQGQQQFKTTTNEFGSTFSNFKSKAKLRLRQFHQYKKTAASIPTTPLNGSLIGEERASSPFNQSINQSPIVIEETIPYTLQQAGPNVHQFKFQNIKRINHQRLSALNNIIEEQKQYKETQRQIPQVISRRRNNASVSDPKFFSRHFALKHQNKSRSPEMNHDLMRPNFDFEGSVEDRVREELNRTVKAKKRLLANQYVNFRFDEFIPKNIEIHAIKESQSLQKKHRLQKSSLKQSIETYTPNLNLSDILGNQQIKKTII